MLVVNEEVHGKVRPEQIPLLISEYMTEVQEGIEAAG